jgi:hypothetical protein
MRERREGGTEDDGPDHEREDARDAEEVEIVEGQEQSDANAKAKDISSEVIHVSEKVAHPRLRGVSAVAHEIQTARRGAVGATSGVDASVQI